MSLGFSEIAFGILRAPGRVILGWLLLTATVAGLAPNLTNLAAEGQAKMLAPDAESRLADALVKKCWPESAYESLAVAAFYRPEGLTPRDRDLVGRLYTRVTASDRPREVLRALGPAALPEITQRLTSPDGTMTLMPVSLATSFVAPISHDAVAWLIRQTESPELKVPAGLQIRWTGDAVIGRDYMANVQTSLDRAAVATVLLLLIVLLLVYRSFWLAMVPLLTIGVSVIISRGLLAWLILAGWEVSPLVELFLIALLFGTGTDFCLFLSLRYAEHLNSKNPVASMRVTLSRSVPALVTSAGTIIVGLLLMGTTHFKLFSSTGPSVALGLILALAATLTLTPALLILLARFHPRSFDGLGNGHREFWHRVGALAMARPLRTWLFTILAMLPLSILGARTGFIQDLLTELPRETSAARDFQLIATKFDPGMLAPLTLVLESDTDLRGSEGLALIDDVSRLLSHQRSLSEVRSATQPLGSPDPLRRARLTSRLGEVNAGFRQLAEGAAQLRKGLTEGAAKLRAVIWFEEKTGLALTGKSIDKAIAKSDPAASRVSSRENLVSGLKQASSVLQWSQGVPSTWNLAALSQAFDALSNEAKTGSATGITLPQLVQTPAILLPSTVAKAEPAPLRAPQKPKSEGMEKPRNESPQELLLSELTRAAEGASQIFEGAGRANREVSAILTDPVGRRALDHLLINDQTVHDNPSLLKSFAAYITPDGHHARIDLTQADRIFSNDAMNQVITLRRRLNDYLGEYEGINVTARIAGNNAESADIRALTRADQVQSWFIVPIGVFLVLLIALRDPLACVNLVLTMVLTYVFALGTTHLLFVTLLGADGLDWKVPYFLFVLLVAVGVDYNVFLMSRLHEESQKQGLRNGIVRAIGNTGGLITSAAAITACSFASFLFSPLASLRQLGFALVVGILVDAILVRPLLVPCGHWLLHRTRQALSPRIHVAPKRVRLVASAD